MLYELSNVLYNLVVTSSASSSFSLFPFVHGWHPWPSTFQLLRVPVHGSAAAPGTSQGMQPGTWYANSDVGWVNSGLERPPDSPSVGRPRTISGRFVYGYFHQLCCIGCYY